MKLFVASLVLVPAIAHADPAPREPTWIVDAEFGVAALRQGGTTTIVHGISGLNVGAGMFVAPHVALSLRLSGVTLLDGALFYLGMVGPHAQLFVADEVFIGAGVGGWSRRAVGRTHATPATADSATTSAPATPSPPPTAVQRFRSS
jgi:hypothetical protein